jgi:hypothetical protein
MKPNSKFDHVYAIVRVDEYPGLVVPTEETVSVIKVLWEAEAAKREVGRLNAQRRTEGSHYFLQVTRLERKEQLVTVPVTISSIERVVEINPRPARASANSPQAIATAKAFSRWRPAGLVGVSTKG